MVSDRFGRVRSMLPTCGHRSAVHIGTVRWCCPRRYVRSGRLHWPRHRASARDGELLEGPSLRPCTLVDRGAAPESAEGRLRLLDIAVHLPGADRLAALFLMVDEALDILERIAEEDADLMWKLVRRFPGVDPAVSSPPASASSSRLKVAPAYRSPVFGLLRLVPVLSQLKSVSDARGLLPDDRCRMSGA